MASATKPIKLHSHSTGPNPWKVAILLEELGVPYENVFHQFPELKQAPFEAININGRVPAIEDPNTGINLWESGAIVEYLVATYDKAGKLSYLDKVPERFLTQQWLHFQMSGQGPYFGQAAWFHHFHAEKIPSAQERYAKEIDRVLSVLDRHLASNGGAALVGSKITYADLAFVPWNNMIPFILGADNGNAQLAQYPHFKKWHDSLVARPAVAKVLKDKSDAMAAGK